MTVALWLCVTLVFTICAEIHGSVQCIGNNDKPVDWFIVYKLPRLEGNVHEAIQEGVGFYYMDNNAQYWTLSDTPINATQHAVWYTLEQAYKNAENKDIFYAFYNDQKPDGGTSLSHGHTKGDLVFDTESGFWLVHSVPHFPPLVSDGYSYPPSGHTYGQTLMCVSYKTNQLNEIGKQLFFNYPWVYDWNLPESMQAANPDLTLALHGKHPTDTPWSRTTQLTSLEGQEFVSFAKFTDFEADLYDCLVAPYLKSPLMVESWQNARGKTASNCSTVFQVINIEELSIEGVAFNETHDHSKWCVTTHLDVFQSGRTWVCVGDINRVDTQRKRGGGTVCSILPDAWLGFQRTIKRFESCDNHYLKYYHSIDVL